MKKAVYILNLSLIAFLLVLGGYNLYTSYFPDRDVKKTAGYYTCPMHPEIHEDKPGKCPICGMKLVHVETHDNAEQEMTNAEKIIDHYTCPMHPEIHEDKPGNCPICGMKLVPVYEESGGQKESSVHIPVESQNLIGVKTTKVIKRSVKASINTTGRVAFDPDLYVAVKEYLSVMNSDYELRRGAAARLKLLGMGEEEIKNLPFRKKSYESLYLPSHSGSVWVYATAYENELAYLRPGTKAQIQNPYIKKQRFSGVIRSLSPVVDPETRSIKVRIEIPGAGGKLLPDSFVNVSMDLDMGIALVVPRSAMLDSGEDQIVFVLRDKTRFVRRSVIAGPEAGEDVVILSGLEEGEDVVSAATFLVDSESRLKSAVPESEEHHR